MAARSIGSGIISLGLVTIPIKVFSATRSQRVGFNLLHRTCSSRLNQELVCNAHAPPERITDRAEQTIRGYEHTRGSYVTFTDEEIKALETERPDELVLEHFVPASTVDLVYVEKTFYLGPDKGAAKPYQLLVAALEHTGMLGVGTFAKRGKANLVFVRAHAGALHLHEGYYANEVLPLAELELDTGAPVERALLDLAVQYIRRCSMPAFDPSLYRDTWADRVQAAVAAKIGGEEVLVSAPPVAPPIVDLLEALKASVDKMRASSPPGPDANANHKGPKKAAPRAPSSARKRRTTDAG